VTHPGCQGALSKGIRVFCNGLQLYLRWQPAVLVLNGQPDRPLSRVWATVWHWGCNRAAAQMSNTVLLMSSAQWLMAHLKGSWKGPWQS